MSKTDGGTAFPHYTATGMSLRDWFAGQALSRDLAQGIYTDHQGMLGVAAASYAMADAMLAERAKAEKETT